MPSCYPGHFQTVDLTIIFNLKADKFFKILYFKDEKSTRECRQTSYIVISHDEPTELGPDSRWLLLARRGLFERWSLVESAGRQLDIADATAIDCGCKSSCMKRSDGRGK